MPPTPNNLLPPIRAKQRTARISKEYLGRQSALEVWRKRLTVIAVLAAVVWIAYAAIGDRGQQVYSRGPVANVHAMWENNCQACHVDFTPISGSAGGISLSAWSNVTDAKCQQCHAGPAHHATGLADTNTAGTQSANCATCHADHRGRDADLTRVADRHCTDCHGVLQDFLHKSRFDHPIEARITGFSAKSHPRFRSVAKDPGRLKFNHALHMTAGLTHGGEGRNPLTKDKLPEELQQRYELDAKGFVQLDCNSCHQLDGSASAVSTSLSGANQLVPGSGDYYRPVAYEQHCAACHPLPSRISTEKNAAAHVPHGLNAEQLESRVREIVLADVVRRIPELQDEPRETIPGNEPPVKLTETVRAQFELDVNSSAHYLTTAVCAKCHDTQRDTSLPQAQELRQRENNGGENVSRESASADTGDVSFPAVAAVEVPAVWLKHARFDHSAHRALACVDCHARAYSTNPEASRLASDVLVPNIDNCVNCHAPQDQSDGAFVGGARHDCVECHLYHGRHGPVQRLEGRHSALRAVEVRRSIDEWLGLIQPNSELQSTPDDR